MLISQHTKSDSRNLWKHHCELCRLQACLLNCPEVLSDKHFGLCNVTFKNGFENSYLGSIDIDFGFVDCNLEWCVTTKACKTCHWKEMVWSWKGKSPRSWHQTLQNPCVKWSKAFDFYIFKRIVNMRARVVNHGCEPQYIKGQL